MYRKFASLLMTLCIITSGYSTFMMSQCSSEIDEEEIINPKDPKDPKEIDDPKDPKDPKEIDDPIKDQTLLKEINEKFEEISKAKFEETFIDDYEVSRDKHEELKPLLDLGQKLKETKKISQVLNFDYKGIEFFKKKFQDSLDFIYQNIHKNNPKHNPKLLLDNDGVNATIYSVNADLLKKLDPTNKPTTTLIISRLVINFNYKLSFKKLTPLQKQYKVEVYLTNNLDFKDKVHKQLSEDINRILFDRLKEFIRTEDGTLRWIAEYVKFAVEKLDFEMLKRIGLKKINEFIILRLEEYARSIGISVSTKPEEKDTYGISLDMDIEQKRKFDVLNISDLSDAYKAKYSNASKTVTEFKDFFFQKITNEKLKIDKLEDSNNKDNTPQYNFYSFKVLISKIVFQGLRIKGKYLYDYNKNKFKKELQINLHYYKPELKEHVNKIVTWMVHFFHYYQMRIDKENTKILFFVEKQFYESIKNDKVNLKSINVLLNKLIHFFQTLPAYTHVPHHAILKDTIKFNTTPFALEYMKTHYWKVSDDWIKNYTFEFSVKK